MNVTYEAFVKFQQLYATMADTPIITQAQPLLTQKSAQSSTLSSPGPSHLASSLNTSTPTSESKAPEKKLRKYKKQKLASSNSPQTSSGQSVAKAKTTNQFDDTEVSATHALVNWLIDNTYTVVPISYIKRHYSDDVELVDDQVFKCTWTATEILEATLILTGS